MSYKSSELLDEKEGFIDDNDERRIIDHRQVIKSVMSWFTAEKVNYNCCVHEDVECIISECNQHFPICTQHLPIFKHREQQLAYFENKYHEALLAEYISPMRGVQLFKVWRGNVERDVIIKNECDVS